MAQRQVDMITEGFSIKVFAQYYPIAFLDNLYNVPIIVSRTPGALGRFYLPDVLSLKKRISVGLCGGLAQPANSTRCWGIYCKLN